MQQKRCFMDMSIVGMSGLPFRGGFTEELGFLDRSVAYTRDAFNWALETIWLHLLRLIRFFL